jgi:hypothetical protein
MPIPAGPSTGVSAEIAAQRRITRAFIAADEDMVVLWRSVQIPDGAGGYELNDPSPLPSQPMRLIPLQSGATERHTLDGVLVAPGYALLGDWFADMERWDTFTMAGVRYQVVFINENRTYEVKGEVVYLA